MTPKTRMMMRPLLVRVCGLCPADFRARFHADMLTTIDLAFESIPRRSRRRIAPHTRPATRRDDREFCGRRVRQAKTRIAHASRGASASAPAAGGGRCPDRAASMSGRCRSRAPRWHLPRRTPAQGSITGIRQDSWPPPRYQVDGRGWGCASSSSSTTSIH